MKRNERLNDPVTAFLAAFQGLQSGLWTAVPGQVVSFNTTNQTVEVQPQVQARWVDEKGAEQWLTLPLLVDVPVVFPSAGGYSLTFPVKAGDPCLVVFSSRNIDTWWDTGAAGVVNDRRLHDLSDGFCILGPRPRPNAIPNIVTNGVMLRNEDGSANIKIDDDQLVSVTTTGDVEVIAEGDVIVESGGSVTVDATGSLEATAAEATVTAATINLVGNVIVTGTLTTTGNIASGGTVVDSTGKSLGTHVHTGNNVNTPLTGPPQ